MNWVVHLTALLASGGYAAAVFLLVRSLRGQSSLNRGRIWSIAVPAVMAHGVNVYLQVFTPAGIQLGVVAASALFGFVLAASSTAIGYFRRMEALMAPAWLMSLMFIAASAISTDAQPPVTRLDDGLVAHIVISIVSYTLVMLAGSQAVLIMIQNHHLKRRHMHLLLKYLPPLQTMENILFDFVIAGWLGLTASIGTGFLFVDNLMAQHLAHKTFFTIAAWGVFGVLLAGRLRAGWRGMTAVRWTFAGFALLMVGYFGTQIILQFILER
jgi:ABC-type uncharacterized transport system permease subunit